jgi:putative phosphoesterase
MEPMALPGRRFAVIADSHDIHAEWAAALVDLAEAWGSIDAILHCGDLSSAQALESLERMAPVYATRSEMDPPPMPPMLEEGPRLFRVGGIELGMIHSVGEGALTPDTATRLFGRKVDVCLFGGTHAPQIASAGGTLFVNPGSPTLSQRRSTAILTVDGEVASVDLKLL